MRPLLHFLWFAVTHVNEDDCLLRVEHFKAAAAGMQAQVWLVTHDDAHEGVTHTCMTRHAGAHHCAAAADADAAAAGADGHAAAAGHKGVRCYNLRCRHAAAERLCEQQRRLLRCSSEVQRRRVRARAGRAGSRGAGGIC